MKAARYINLHTHSSSSVNAGEEQVLALLNTYPGEKDKHNLPNISCGIHPWFINEQTWPQELEELKNIATQGNVLAVGECGLDALKGPSMELQTEVFLKQLELAVEVRKPVIIHCVKAYEAVMKTVGELKEKPVCILHGFNKSPELAMDLLKHGFYLSLRSAVMNDQDTAHDYSHIPLDRIFLETDDKEIPIQTVYLKACQRWHISEETLIQQIQNNFRTLFTQA